MLHHCKIALLCKCLPLEKKLTFVPTFCTLNQILSTPILTRAECRLSFWIPGDQKRGLVHFAHMLSMYQHNRIQAHFQLKEILQDSSAPGFAKLQRDGREAISSLTRQSHGELQYALGAPPNGAFAYCQGFKTSDAGKIDLFAEF